MKRILFIGESAALSHIGRPYTLARYMAQNNYEVHFACDDNYKNLLTFDNICYHEIYSQPQKKFLCHLKYGLPLISKKDLKKYIAEELKLIDKIKPDVIVGDLRLTLAITARMKKIPYINIINAHWSSYAVKKEYPLGKHPLTKIFGYELSQKISNYTSKDRVKWQVSAFNELREENHLTSYNSMEEFLSDGDITIFPDIKELSTLTHVPNNHYFVGPINYEPEMNMPDWFVNLPKDKRKIYLSFGSTGNLSAQEKVFAALGEIDAIVLYATAGIKHKKSYPKNFYVTEYLPGSEICKATDLTISNGGIQSIHQSLLAGSPIIGLCVNTDQMIAMSAIENNNFGKIIRNDQVDTQYIKEVVQEYLFDQQYSQNINKFMQNAAIEKSEEVFLKILQNMPKKS